MAVYDGGSSLQSKDHRDLLDIIDKLRAQGISRFVDLPQIIVCGDQSSGKSSVLEAISGLSFPTKDNLCTRFATELILRRSASVGIEVHITPGPDRSKEEKDRLGAFRHAQSDLDIGQIVESAKDAMGLNGDAKVFSTDILRVEISGPSQPHLTMVDLPGLFLAGNKDQTEHDSELVESLVLSYMKKPRSIILAVVSAKSDFALQQVTRHTRNLDPQGLRTLGLITKPDTLDEGSDSEQFFVELTQNKDVQFKLGWHVLRNRNYTERDVSMAERDRIETEFFSGGVWTLLDGSQLGVEALKLRLSGVLRNQILVQLPNVLRDVEVGMQECELKLQKLGDSRVTISEQRRYLLRTSSSCSYLLKAAIDGVYTDVLFRDVEMRLRAVVQNTLSDFAQQMRHRGHTKIIQDDPACSEDDDRVILRSTYMEEVKRLMRESRGRELPGTYNPLIVADLFREQCKPWQALAHEFIEQVFGAASITVAGLIQHFADERTAESLLREVVGPSMESLKVDLMTKTDEILKPHLSGHPITYNHYLTENVQKAQAGRHRQDLEKRMKSFFREDELAAGATNYRFDMRSLLDTLVYYMEPDMDKFSCSMAIDMMEAYYKVALKKLVDDVSILAVEECLIQKLPSLLSSDVICGLTDAEIQRLAGESTESAAERKRATEKLTVLENGMVELKRLKKYYPSILRHQDNLNSEAVKEDSANDRDILVNASATLAMESIPQTLETYMPETSPISLEQPEFVEVDDNFDGSKNSSKKGRKKKWY